MVGRYWFTFEIKGERGLGYFTGVGQFGSLWGVEWDGQKWSEKERLFLPWMIQSGVEPPSGIPLPPVVTHGEIDDSPTEVDL